MLLSGSCPPFFLLRGYPSGAKLVLGRGASPRCALRNVLIPLAKRGSHMVAIFRIFSRDG
jgi:hypothetical protein